MIINGFTKRETTDYYMPPEWFTPTDSDQASNSQFAENTGAWKTWPFNPRLKKTVQNKSSNFSNKLQGKRERWTYRLKETEYLYQPVEIYGLYLDPDSSK